jgi:hypothetical protein
VALSGILEKEPGDLLGEHVLSHGEDDQLLCVSGAHRPAEFDREAGDVRALPPETW